MQRGTLGKWRRQCTVNNKNWQKVLKRNNTIFLGDGKSSNFVKRPFVWVVFWGGRVPFIRSKKLTSEKKTQFLFIPIILLRQNKPYFDLISTYKYIKSLSWHLLCILTIKKWRVSIDPLKQMIIFFPPSRLKIRLFLNKFTKSLLIKCSEKNF